MRGQEALNGHAPYLRVHAGNPGIAQGRYIAPCNISISYIHVGHAKSAYPGLQFWFFILGQAHSESRPESPRTSFF